LSPFLAVVNVKLDQIRMCLILLKGDKK
jgi:hypothetical protein